MEKVRVKSHHMALMTPIFHKKLVVMRASAEARIRSDRATKSGLASVYIQIIINGDRTTVPLNVSWPVIFFDNKKGKFLKRSKQDQEAEDYNMLVRKEKSKINEIVMFYRHSDFDLTIEQFKREYKRFDSRKDFCTWVLADVQERFDSGKVELQTLKNAKSGVAFLMKYKSSIKFNELNEEFLENLEAYGRRNDCSINTIIGRLSMVKNYAKRAHKSGIGVNILSLDQYTMPHPTSRIVFLEPEELNRLKFYYSSCEITNRHKTILGQFLFSCCTGLRYSDLVQVHWKNIYNDMLELIQYKGRKSQKINRVPLIEEAYSYIQNEKSNLFNTMKEQPTNRLLKEIAIICKIRKNITTHVGRHTFATEFLRKGGHLEVLNKLLGHKKISTTMIYVHVNTQRLKDQMTLFSQVS